MFDPKEHAKKDRVKTHAENREELYKEFETATQEGVDKLRNINLFGSLGITEKILELESYGEHDHYTICREQLEKIKRHDNVLFAVTVFVTITEFAKIFPLIILPIVEFSAFMLFIMLLVAVSLTCSIVKRDLRATFAFVFFEFVYFALSGQNIIGLFLASPIMGCISSAYFLLMLIMVPLHIRDTIVWKIISKTEGYPLFVEFTNKNRERAKNAHEKIMLGNRVQQNLTIEIPAEFMPDIETPEVSDPNSENVNSILDITKL